MSLTNSKFGIKIFKSLKVQFLAEINYSSAFMISTESGL